MKNIVKRLTGLIAALAIIATTAAGVTAQAATVTSYKWESTSDGGATWGTIPGDMNAAIANIDYDDAADTFTITTAGTVLIYGVPGEITSVKLADASGSIISSELLGNVTPNEAVLTGITGEPVYVYYKVSLMFGLITKEFATRYTALVY